MVLVQVNLTNAPLAAAEAELRAWADFVRQERPAHVMAPTALCYHHSELLGNGVPLDAVVTAVPGADTDRVTYSETLGEFTFCLNPNSYFQVLPRLSTCLLNVLTHPRADPRREVRACAQLCCPIARTNPVVTGSRA